MTKTLHQCTVCHKIYEAEENAIACESQGITPETPKYKVGDVFTFYDPNEFYENELDENGFATRTITAIVEFGHQRGYTLNKPFRITKEWRVGSEPEPRQGHLDEDGVYHQYDPIFADDPLTDDDIYYLSTALP